MERIRRYFTGAAIVEPLVYGVAQSVQADYDLYDSFLNIGFGSRIGGGLHVGAGKLKDANTRRKVGVRITEGKKILDIRLQIKEANKAFIENTIRKLLKL